MDGCIFNTVYVPDVSAFEKIEVGGLNTPDGVSNVVIYVEEKTHPALLYDRVVKYAVAFSESGQRMYFVGQCALDGLEDSEMNAVTIIKEVIKERFRQDTVAVYRIEGNEVLPAVELWEKHYLGMLAKESGAQPFAVYDAKWAEVMQTIG
jgi:hypothetical protein